MKHIAFVFLIFVSCKQMTAESTYTILPKPLKKDLTTESQDIHQNLKQQNEDLKHLILITKNNENLMKELVDKLAKLTEKPERSDKVEVFLPSRRSTATSDSEQLPLTPIKKDLPTESQDIHQNLKQQNEDLKHLILITKNNENLMKELVDKLAKLTEKPERSDKVEVFLPSRRSTATSDSEQLPLTPIVRLVKSIPRFGKLFVHLISDEIKNQFEPFNELFSKSEENIL